MKNNKVLNLTIKVVEVIKQALLKRKVLSTILFILLIIYLFCLPRNLFNDPISTVITDSEHNLLGAKIADDGQWRFPHSDSIPEKFQEAIVCFEDQYFFKHPGVNPVSIVRAFYLNIKYGRIVSGGSTLSMQVIRMSRKNKRRSIKEKFIEIILATRLELKYSKNEILSLYSSNAPFGGNVVGLEAASWRYFQRSPHDLSWAEVSTLAVLPNAPALIYPGRNKDALKKKRDFLLEKLLKNEVIDSLTLEFAMLEPLPEKPYPLPQHAYHLLMEIYQGEGNAKIIQTTIDSRLQDAVNQIVNYHADKLRSNEINNVAALVVEVETGNVLAYVGNVNYLGANTHGNKVNIINAQRSSGSILKPLLYAAMLDDGEILPATLVADIPSNMTGFTPKNFNLRFDGAVPAKQALSRSLNIPAVRMLRKYSLDKFHYLLKKLGLYTIDKPPGHYGLSLILGGAETTLWEITGVYASLSRTLKHYDTNDGNYSSDDIRPLNYYAKTQSKDIFSSDKGLLSAASIWLTYKSLLEVNRPEGEAGWNLFSSAKKIAWKTGTSFGFRDAWAIGTTPEYVVAVWAGNATGEGRPGLVGVQAAAPVMFDIFNKLPNTTWFNKPVDEMIEVAVCEKSGHRMGQFCESADTIWIPKAGLSTEVCPYHKIIHLDSDEQYRVSSNCYSTDQMVHKSWFVLPPVQEYYYKSRNPAYKTLPPFKEECMSQDQKAMDLIYPNHGIKLYLPVQLDGKIGKIVMEAVHKNSKAQIFWHLDNNYIGLTEGIHQIGISPEEGKHVLTLVDNTGNEISRRFEVFRR